MIRNSAEAKLRRIERARAKEAGARKAEILRAAGVPAWTDYEVGHRYITKDGYGHSVTMVIVRCGRCEKKYAVLLAGLISRNKGYAKEKNLDPFVRNCAGCFKESQQEVMESISRLNKNKRVANGNARKLANKAKLKQSIANRSAND